MSCGHICREDKSLFRLAGYLINSISASYNTQKVRRTSCSEYENDHGAKLAVSQSNDWRVKKMKRYDDVEQKKLVLKREARMNWLVEVCGHTNRAGATCNWSEKWVGSKNCSTSGCLETGPRLSEFEVHCQICVTANDPSTPTTLLHSIETAYHHELPPHRSCGPPGAPYSYPRPCAAQRIRRRRLGQGTFSIESIPD